MSIRTAKLKTLARQRGLTLVELMVSLVLSLVLMLGAMQLFTGSKQTYQLSDALARVQENGRFALDLLSRDIRQAGFTGCIAAPDFSNLLNLTSPPTAAEWPYLFQQPIFGFDGDDATFPTGAATGAPGEVWTVPNAAGEVSDSLVALFGDAAGVFSVTADPADAADVVTIAPAAGLVAGQILLITDCSRSALFEATSVSTSVATTSIGHVVGAGSPGNCENTLHNNCGSGVVLSLLKPYNKDVSRVSPLQASGYYIGNTTRSDVAGNLIPALYRQRLTSDPAQRLRRDELLEGVTDLQVRYGVAPLNERSAEKFVRADQVTAAEWGRVVAVRVDLTLRSVTDPNLTRDFSTTVAIRNRTL